VAVARGPSPAPIGWVHRRLLREFGEPVWESSGAPLDELIGTILSQHTSDLNSERAFAALKAASPTWEAARDAPLEDLIETIRAGGLAVVKAQRIQAVLRALTDDQGQVVLSDLRLQALMALPGVGRKTAACVLLFGAHIPAIPVDTHVHRVALRLGLVPPRTTPEATADALEAALEPSAYYAFHVNLIRLGREICKAPTPRCAVCPLAEKCQFRRSSGRLPGRRGSRPRPYRTAVNGA
jgi:endonuclease III